MKNDINVHQDEVSDLWVNLYFVLVSLDIEYSHRGQTLFILYLNFAKIVNDFEN